MPLAQILGRRDPKARDPAGHRAFRGYPHETAKRLNNYYNREASRVFERGDQARWLKVVIYMAVPDAF